MVKIEMSEQEETRNTGEPSVIVKQAAATESTVKSYQSTDQDEPTERRQKWSKVPAVPSVNEDLKDVTRNISTVPLDSVQEKPDRKLQDHGSAEPCKHHVSKLLSTSLHVRGEIKNTETVILSTIPPDPVVKVIPSQAKLADVKSIASGDSVRATKKRDEDSITDEVAELPTIETSQISDWSDEQEAGGLPRSESRSSRVSRAVRQFFCCAVAYSPASEDDISARVGSGI